MFNSSVLFAVGSLNEEEAVFRKAIPVYFTFFFHLVYKAKFCVYSPPIDLSIFLFYCFTIRCYMIPSGMREKGGLNLPNYIPQINCSKI